MYVASNNQCAGRRSLFMSSNLTHLAVCILVASGHIHAPSSYVPCSLNLLRAHERSLKRADVYQSHLDIPGAAQVSMDIAKDMSLFSKTAGLEFSSSFSVSNLTLLQHMEITLLLLNACTLGFCFIHSNTKGLSVVFQSRAAQT